MSQHAGSSLTAIFRITTRCNFDCSFCGYRRSDGGPRTDVSLDMFQEVCAFLRGLAVSRGISVNLSMLGGEPLLWRDLRAGLSMAQASGLRTSITTNGALLRRRFEGGELAGLNDLTVSLDGLPPIHAAARHLTTVQNQRLFDDLADVISRLRANGTHVRVAMILDARSVAQIEPAGQAYAALGFEEMVVNPLWGAVGDPYFDRCRLPVPAVHALRDALPQIRRRLRDDGIELLLSDEYLTRIENYAMGIRRPILNCQFEDAQLYISELGYVSPCTYAMNSFGIQIGADAADTLSELVIRRRMKLDSACWDCPATFPFGKFAKPAQAHG